MVLDASADVLADTPRATFDSCDGFLDTWTYAYEPACGVPDRTERGFPWPTEATGHTNPCSDPRCDATNCEFVPPMPPRCGFYERVEWPCSGAREFVTEFRYDVIDEDHVEALITTSSDGNVFACPFHIARRR